MRLLSVLVLLAIVAGPAHAQKQTVTVPGSPRQAPAPEPLPPVRSRPAATPVAAAPVQAQAPSMFDVYGEFAVEYGGDDVVELLFTDGGSQTLTAGQGGTLAVGARVRPSVSLPVSAFASVGYKFVLNASDNADIRLTRIPVELGIRGDLPGDAWAELAYTLHTAITLNGDDFFADQDFDTAHGATVAAGWRWIGASYTAITYSAEDGTDVGASNVGITVRLSRSDF